MKGGQVERFVGHTVILSNPPYVEESIKKRHIYSITGISLFLVQLTVSYFLDRYMESNRRGV